MPSSIVGSAGKIDLKLGASDTGLVRWLLDGSAMTVDWNKPTLGTTLMGSTDFYPNANVYELSTSNWYIWYIESTDSFQLPHPIHLHGHDFYIIGEGSGQWDGSVSSLNLNNPTRRDTTTMPLKGYLVLAFPADNPGAWVVSTIVHLCEECVANEPKQMHCHIAWHASQGLALQFLERKGEIMNVIGDLSGGITGCNEWDGYWFPGNHPYNMTDSGI